MGDLDEALRSRTFERRNNFGINMRHPPLERDAIGHLRPYTHWVALEMLEGGGFGAGRPRLDYVDDSMLCWIHQS
jgi:hypothetical protein